jgi:hypothetical protein
LLTRVCPSSRFQLISVSELFLPRIFLALLQANSCARQLRGFCSAFARYAPPAALSYLSALPRYRRWNLSREPEEIGHLFAGFQKYLYQPAA